MTTCVAIGYCQPVGSSRHSKIQYEITWLVAGGSEVPQKNAAHTNLISVKSIGGL